MNRAFQTSNDIDSIYKEANRVLKDNGTFLFLSSHPMRQFVEKYHNRQNNDKNNKKNDVDYFHQETVMSKIFQNQVVVYEPSHTMQDYLTNYFLTYFDLKLFEEGIDKGAEKVLGENVHFPSYIIIKASKKKL